MRIDATEHSIGAPSPENEAPIFVPFEDMQNARADSKKIKEKLPAVFAFDIFDQNTLRVSDGLTANESPLVHEPNSPWDGLSKLGDNPITREPDLAPIVNNDAVQQENKDGRPTRVHEPKMLWSAEHNIEMSQVGGREDTQHYWPGADYVDEPTPAPSNDEANVLQSVEELAKPVGDLARAVGDSLLSPMNGIALPGNQIDDWWRSAFGILEREHDEGLR